MTMAMTSLSIVLTVFVLQLHHPSPSQRPVPNWIKKVVFGVIARIVGMKSIVNSAPYHLHDDITKDELHLSTFIDTLENSTRETTCNGGIPLQSSFRINGHEKPERINHGNHQSDKNNTYDKISKHLKFLVAKQDYEDQYQDIVNEWRLVAVVMDRCLFWSFLLLSTLSTLVILVILPLTKPSANADR